MIYISFELNIATLLEFIVDPLVLTIPYKIETTGGKPVSNMLRYINKHNGLARYVSIMLAYWSILDWISILKYRSILSNRTVRVSKLVDSELHRYSLIE